MINYYIYKLKDKDGKCRSINGNLTVSEKQCSKGAQATGTAAVLRRLSTEVETRTRESFTRSGLMLVAKKSSQHFHRADFTALDGSICSQASRRCRFPFPAGL